jgi:hypothetical protein
MKRPYQATVVVSGVTRYSYTRAFRCWAEFARQFDICGGRPKLPWTTYKMWAGGHTKITFEQRH